MYAQILKMGQLRESIELKLAILLSKCFTSIFSYSLSKFSANIMDLLDEGKSYSKEGHNKFVLKLAGTRK